MAQPSNSPEPPAAPAHTRGPEDLSRTDAGLPGRVQAQIDATLAARGAVMTAVSPQVAPMHDGITRLMAGGKRLRARFAYWGWRAAGAPDSDVPVIAGAALEFFQAAALLHDDVMDQSDTRRGEPALHRALATHHRSHHWSSDPDQFGVGGAILAGDLCLTWSDEVFAGCGAAATGMARGRAVFDLMRTELMAGQYLDLLEQAVGQVDAARARRVIRYKSAKYSVEHPLLIGAALATPTTAGSTAAAAANGTTAAPAANGTPTTPVELALSAFGLAIGEAFQLRDDLLGVFGDSRATGKPAGDDLREGKQTLLIAYAREAATATQRARINQVLGDPHLTPADADDVRSILTDTGAVGRIEADLRLLSDRAAAALHACSAIDPGARSALLNLATAAVYRTF